LKATYEIGGIRVSRRRLSLAVVCAVLVVLCTVPALGAQKVTITFGNFSAGSDNEATLAAMKAAFEKANPDIEVKLHSTGYGEYFRLLQTQIAGGTAPDCYELNYENFVAFAAKNALVDLGPLAKTTGVSFSGYDANALDAFKYNGKQFGVPGSYSVVLLFYNKDLFDQAKIPYPNDDWTWNDVIEAGKKIRALGDDIFGIYQPVQFWEFYKTIAQNGGSLFNGDQTKFTVNSPENIEALQYMVDKVIKHNIQPTEAQKSGQGDWDIFAAGKVGMIVTGNWAFTFMKDAAKCRWDVAVEPGNTQKGCHFFSNGYVINESSKKQEAALRWITWLSSSQESSMLRVEAGWETPPVSDESVINAYVAQRPPENRKAVFDSLKYLVTPPVIEQFNEMAAIVDLQLEKAREGEKTPQQALDDAQRELEQKIKL
jgi:multiple sugar transport system substrate-binding protein